MPLLDAPLASTEFLVVDTETNGLAGDACELTEVGAVLVGGGELHDRWETLVGVRAPLSRRIQRFTGITQEMVDGAPACEAVLPELGEQMDGRVLVGHNVTFDKRVLAQAFERAGLEWPDPPTLCTVALARRLAPLAQQRKLAALAATLGIEVETVHRALADAETCARVFCALFPRLCEHAATVGDALSLVRPKPRARVSRPRGGGLGKAPPGVKELPHAPGVYVFRNDGGQPLYVGKSVDLRTRARSHFARSSSSADWTRQVATVDHRVTRSELGALLLETRLIRAMRPPGNVKLNKHQDGYVYLRCRFDVNYPALEIAPEPAAGHAVNVGPLRGRAAAVELKEQLDSLFGLRHCGRKLPKRQWPSAYGQMGRCMSPCLGDLDPNAYRRKLDEALALFTTEGDGGAALLAHVEAQMRAAAEREAYERAAWLRRRHTRLRHLLERLGPLLRAAHADAKVVLAGVEGGEGLDAFWLVGGRIVDWGPLGGGAPAAGSSPAEVTGDPLEDLRARTLAAVRRSREPYVPADEVPELRVVSTWIAAHEPPALDLGHAVDPAALEGLRQRAEERFLAASS